MAEMTLTGIEGLTARFQALEAQTIGVVGDALLAEAQAILAVSQTRVPVDTGLLRSTGEVEGPFVTAKSVEVEMRYGGHGVAPYAAKQEFDATLNHPHGGQAFYLSQSFYEATAGMAERLAEHIHAALGG